jgi:hypothetical protein
LETRNLWTFKLQEQLKINYFHGLSMWSPMSTFQNASCSIHLYHEHHYILFGWKAFSVGKFVNLLAKNVMFDTTQLFGGTKYWWLPWIRWNSGVSLHWSFSELQFNFFILVNFFPWPLYSKIYTKYYCG